MNEKQRSRPNPYVFLSHATEDLERARWVRRALEEAGWTVFLAKDDLDAILGSAQWSARIDDLLQRVYALVVLVSPEARDSKWVEYEWRTFHNDLLDRRAGTLIPICLGDISPQKLPPALRFRQAVDARDEKWDQAIRSVVAQLESFERQSPPELPPPTRERPISPPKSNRPPIETPVPPEPDRARHATLIGVAAIALPVIAWAAWPGERSPQEPRPLPSETVRPIPRVPDPKVTVTVSAEHVDTLRELRIALDGEPRCTRSPCTIEVPAASGPHTLLVTAPGYHPDEGPIEPPNAVNVKLQPLPIRPSGLPTPCNNASAPNAYLIASAKDYEWQGWLEQARTFRKDAKCAAIFVSKNDPTNRALALVGVTKDEGAAALKKFTARGWWKPLPNDFLAHAIVRKVSDFGGRIFPPACKLGSTRAWGQISPSVCETQPPVDAVEHGTSLSFYWTTPTGVECTCKGELVTPDE